MPLTPQKEAVQPNAIYAPQIIIGSGIADGQLKTNVQILLSGAIVENDQWLSRAGSTTSIDVPDIDNLPEDLAALSPQVQQIFTDIVTLIGQVNAIRKAI